ncbi:MAG: hypothetical protein V4494_07325 [Chlamydiota bacterium]
MTGNIISISNREQIYSFEQADVEDFSSLPLEPTLKAKIVAQRCIKHLSTPAVPVDMNAIVDELVTVNEFSEIEQLVVPHVVNGELNEKALKDRGFVLIGKGSHNSVWAHSDYPRVAFKFMSPEAAKTQVEGAKRVREACRGNYWLKAPLSTWLEVDGMGVYMEERLPLGLGYDEQLEVWIRIIQYYQSSESSEMFKNNFLFVIQSMIRVAEKGFWDIGYKNFPEISLDGRYFCAVDFENLDDSNIIEGIERISELVPFEPFLNLIRPKIVDRAPEALAKQIEANARYAKYNITIYPEPSMKKIMDKFDDRMASKLDEAFTLTERLNFYDANGVVTGNENISKTLTKEAYSQLNDVERGFVDYTLAEIENHIDMQKDEMKTVTRKRDVSCFPRGYKISPELTKGMSELEIQQYSQELYIRCLCFLKDYGVIFNYTEDSSGKHDNIALNYTIYY